MKFLNDSTVCAKLNKYKALTAAIMRTLWNNPEQTTYYYSVVPFTEHPHEQSLMTSEASDESIPSEL